MIYDLGVYEKLGILPLTETEFIFYTKTLMSLGKLEIVPPRSSSYKSFNFLKRIFGAEYESYLNECKEVFYANKKLLCGV